MCSIAMLSHAYAFCRVSRRHRGMLKLARLQCVEVEPAPVTTQVGKSAHDGAQTASDYSHWMRQH